MPGKAIKPDLAVMAAACRAAGHPDPVPEYAFLEGRRYRFDLAWPALLVAFEREGGTWGKSRHTSGKGYAADAEKYSRAAIAGWCVVRATVDMIRSGLALTLLLDALASRRPR